MASANGGNKDLKGQIAKQGERKQMTIEDFIGTRKAEIQALLPSVMSPERLMRLAAQTFRSTPRLRECKLESFMGALLTTAQFGLEPNTPLGEAYIIPYGQEATFQLGYQGILALAYRTGKYKSIYVREVYVKDEFEVVYGLYENLLHTPHEDGPEANELPTYIYAVYHLQNGGYSFEAWSWNKIMKHAQKYSKSFNKKDGAWKTNPVAMAKKTVLIALLKYAPKSIELARAMEVDNSAQQDIGGKRDYIDITDYSVREENGENPSDTEQQNEEKEETGTLPSDSALDFEQAMNG